LGGVLSDGEGSAEGDTESWGCVNRSQTRKTV
jgi:hypothetical protein